MTRRQWTILAAWILLAAMPVPAEAEDVVATFAVNDYFGMDYRNEPVSHDVTFDEPVPADRIEVVGQPCQVEVLEGTAEAVRKARVWIVVGFPFEAVERTVGKGDEQRTETVRRPPGPEGRHKVFTVVVHKAGQVRSDRPSPVTVRPVDADGPLPLAEVDTGAVAVRVPVGGAAFDEPASPFELPGPVVSISRDGGPWIGSGYLSAMRRVSAVRCETTHGPVFFETRLTYEFEGGRRYTSRVRLFAGKPYAQLVEDFDVGGSARFVFNYDDWFTDGFFRTGDQRLVGWQPITKPNPCGDFVRIAGQEALARLVIWSQFNYFGGKQETIALKAPDEPALHQAHAAAVEKYQADLAKYHAKLESWNVAQAKYQRQLAAYEKDPESFRRKPRKPRGREPREPRRPRDPNYREITHTIGGAPIRATTEVTPGGDATAVGAFYIRPDRWTRAKVNHVDLYLRPEVPGARTTRGIVGLDGAVGRIAMEAWLVDGHREWAIFAVRAGDRHWLAKAHVVEGVWPLDRINRLPLVWNADGSPVAPEHTAPTGGPVGGTPGRVLKSTGGRAGLQTFNGSNGNIRGAKPPAEGWDGTVENVRAETADRERMVNLAMTAYLAGDDSAYPSRRAMLPWTHPEAINPFYQGMENMNFNADLYRYVTKYGMQLAKLGHPEADRFISHGEDSLDLALDRYVYPESGCWEESHNYAGHTLKVVGPLARALANTSGRKNFLNDLRLARMVEFFFHVHSPIDPAFGNRVVPPVGDHGLKTDGPARRFAPQIGWFREASEPEIQRILARAAWLMREDSGRAPEGIEPEKPELTSRWLRGYGTVMRAEHRGRSEVLEVTLAGALPKRKGGRADLTLWIPPTKGEADDPRAISGSAPGFNRAHHTGTARGEDEEITAELNMGSDRWVKGGKARYVLRITRRGESAGTYEGTFRGEEVSGELTARRVDRPVETFLVLRAGQSWGHHHEDKGSMWLWGRNVHFFGDCSWGKPPGGTYWNPYKQGPASGTQIEFEGVTNWTLPCKYPAPWIADEQYAGEYDYALARCRYPFNPKLDLSKSTPVALTNGYDRQVLFVHPEVVIVRDNVETVCPTVWRMHSYQKEGTTVDGGRARLTSPQGPVGELAIVHPEGVELEAIGEFPKLHPWTGKPSEHAGKAFSSMMLRWRMPANTSASWVFTVRGRDDEPPTVDRLDDAGRVVRIRLADGTEILSLMNAKPFAWRGEGIDFEGTVGLVIRSGGAVRLHPIRATRLTTAD